MVQHITNQFRNHPIVQRRPVIKQFVKFAMVGTINTATSLSVYLLLTRMASLDPLVANAGAFIVAVTVSFFLNKNWTFRDQQRAFAKQYSRFFSVSLVGLILSEGIIYVLHKVMSIHDLAAFFVAVGIVMFWNFTANKLWTFRAVPNPEI